jgi:hypothetical protein
MGTSKKFELFSPPTFVNMIAKSISQIFDTLQTKYDTAASL